MSPSYVNDGSKLLASVGHVWQGSVWVQGVVKHCKLGPHEVRPAGHISAHEGRLELDGLLAGEPCSVVPLCSFSKQTKLLNKCPGVPQLSNEVFSTS